MAATDLVNPFVCYADPSKEGSMVADLSPDAETTSMVRLVADYVEKKILVYREPLAEYDETFFHNTVHGTAAIGGGGLWISAHHGGIERTLTDGMRLSFHLAREESIGATIGAHNGIGAAPLLLFGSPELQDRYLPEMANLTRIGAFALTEPSSGSDALSIRTTAEPVDNGQAYILNGQKQFITNAGIAGLYTVFAKVDGAMTAFAVEAESTGLTIGALEHKMGTRGSPVAAVFLDNVRVPAGNVIGTVGEGHRVAFLTLNIGRVKQAFSSLAAISEVIREAALYADQRRQFGRRIADFALIQAKLATMGALASAVEAVAFQTTLAIDQALDSPWASCDRRFVHEVLELMAPACAMAKVFGSEALATVADEGVQLFGGNGYIEDYLVCRTYQGCRIKRIYEGTNEINRLIIGKAFLAGGEAFIDEKMDDGDPLAALLHGVIQTTARQILRNKSRGELTDQETIAGLADLLIELYTIDALRSVETRGRDLVSLAHTYYRALAVDRVLPMIARLAATISSTAAEEVLVNMIRLRQPTTALRTELSDGLVGLGRFPLSIGG